MSEMFYCAAMQDTDDHGWLRQGSTSSGEVAKTYDDWALTYDDTLTSWDYRAPGQAARLLWGRTPPASAILDMGCGTGLTGAALRAVGFTGPIDGLDISAVSLRLAEKRSLYRKLQPANLQTLPLDVPDAAYDALLCIGVLTYVPDSQGVLREFARMVRPGGAVLVSQRDDLFMERDFGGVVEGLAGAGLFADVVMSEPQPYLPDNPDFGPDIQVIYALMTVS